jgi:hypothetical protein
VICGCSIPIHISYDKTTQYKPLAKPIKKIIRKITSKDVFIKSIMIESDSLILPSKLTESEALVLWENYERSGISGFYNFLIKTDLFNRLDKIYLKFVKKIKARSKILKRKSYIIYVDKN